VRLVLSLFGALLLATPALAQSDDETVEGEGMEEAPPEPPPVPRKLKKALKQLKGKEWALASLSLHAVLEDADAEYFHADIRYYLAYCLEQMGMGYSALEEYNRFLEGTGTDGKLVSKGIERSVSLARRMEAGWIIAPGLARLDTSKVSEGDRGPAMYWVGRHHYQEGNYAAARAFLSLVPKKTEFYANARMIEGVTLTREKKPVMAIAPLAAAVNASKDDTDGMTWRVANMNLGRAYYALGNFERAIEHFEATPRGSQQWFESLYEASWAYFRLGRFSGSLAHLQTVDSPFFDGVYHPDATLLRILIFYYLCKYIDGQTMLNEFTEEHRPIQVALDKALARADGNPEELFEALYAWKVHHKDAGVPLPDPVKQYFATDESLVQVGDYLAGIDAELATVAKGRTGWEKSGLRKQVQRELEERKKVAAEDKGREALARLRTMHDVLLEHLGNSELYKIEMITAEKNIYDAAFQGRLAEQVTTRKLDPNVPEGYDFWPFEGEYWVDELGWYEVNTINECLAIQK
jgi:tetratricopeptide (TPR) repeat protein